MKRMELVDFELAFKEAASAHKKVAWVSVFNKAFITIQKVFSFKAKAFSFCLFCYIPHVIPATVPGTPFPLKSVYWRPRNKSGVTLKENVALTC